MALNNMSEHEEIIIVDSASSEPSNNWPADQSSPNSTKRDSLPSNLAGPFTSTESISLKRKHDLTDILDCPASKVPSIFPNFYQILDIFPDIDKEFLRKECCKGFDTNLLTERILEMNNNYPKDIQFQDVLPMFDQFGATTSCIVDNDAATSSMSASTKSASENRPPNKFDRSSTNFNENNNNSNMGVKADLVNTDTENINNLKSLHDPHTEQFEFLISIFPDAEHNFLEEKSKLGKDDLGMFISATLESKDYPKKNVVLNEEELDDVGLYTTSFSVKNFIKVFPDPFTYFMDESRICQPSTHAFAFLKRRYRKHLVKNLNETYKRLKFNLTLTCHYLDTSKHKYETRTAPRSRNEIKMPESKNTPFLKEACFIEHKEEIKDYIDAQAETKALSYQQAKEKGELMQCNCCYDEVLFEECAACNEGDLFCKNCIVKYVEVRIGDGHTAFPCLLDCGSEFSLQLLQNLMDARVFSKLLVRIQMSEVKAANIDGLEDCPFCEFATIPPPDTNIFTCLNPECLKESCRNCHKISHIPLRCEEVENDDQARARKYIEDEMTKALVRECYQCKKSFIKTDGCNKMTCTCGARMCYVCRQPVKDYTHFNGQGGSETHKCPLYSTEETLHVNAVKEVAEKALKALKETNPELQLKHDPTKLLPKASKKAVVANAQPIYYQLGAHLGMVNFVGINPNIRHQFHDNQQLQAPDFLRHPRLNQEPQAHPPPVLDVLPPAPIVFQPALGVIQPLPQHYVPRNHRARVYQQPAAYHPPLNPPHPNECVHNRARHGVAARAARPIQVPNERWRMPAVHTVVNGVQPPALIDQHANAPAQHHVLPQTVRQIRVRVRAQARAQAQALAQAVADQAEALEAQNQQLDNIDALMNEIDNLI